MSKLLDRFRYFKQKGDTFADGHGQVMHTNRDIFDEQGRLCCSSRLTTAVV